MKLNVSIVCYNLGKEILINNAFSNSSLLYTITLNFMPFFLNYYLISDRIS